MATIHPTAPLGLSQQNPVRCTVASSGKALAINQGLQQQRMVSIESLPVSRQSARTVCQDLAGQSCHPHPRQDQEPAVIDRKSTRLNSSHSSISYAVFCLKK